MSSAVRAATRAPPPPSAGHPAVGTLSPMPAASGTTEFWSRAPGLFELATEIGAALERSPTTERVAPEIHRLAAGIPETPEPLSDMDPYLRSALLTAVIHAMRAEEEANRSELRVAVERVRQALRDLLDEQPVWRGGPKDAAMWLRQQHLSVEDIADLLQTSRATVQRWANPQDATEPSGTAADRVMVIAKIVNHLRHAMTARGAVQWLLRPHPALDDRRPVDDLKDPASYRLLVNLAAGTRSFQPT